MHWYALLFAVLACTISASVACAHVQLIYAESFALLTFLSDVFQPVAACHTCRELSVACRGNGSEREPWQLSLRTRWMVDSASCSLLRVAELLLRQRVLAAIFVAARDSSSGSRYIVTGLSNVGLVCALADLSGSQKDPGSVVCRGVSVLSVGSNLLFQEDETL